MSKAQMQYRVSDRRYPLWVEFARWPPAEQRSRGGPDPPHDPGAGRPMGLWWAMPTSEVQGLFTPALCLG